MNGPIISCGKWGGKRSGRWFLISLVLVVVACAGRSQEAASKANETQALRSEVEDLQRAVNASYDRERALALRLQSTEESNTQLRQEMEQRHGQLGSLKGNLDTLTVSSTTVAVGLPTAASGSRDRPSRASTVGVPRRYEAARSHYTDRQYERAVKEFAAILRSAPTSDLADNAQYWLGECYFGMGRFRQALTEFTKVFAYRNTEKDDDAQLKIARCYLSLGEKNQALSALRKLIDEYPESEYVANARRELRQLQGR